MHILIVQKNNTDLFGHPFWTILLGATNICSQNK